MYLNACAVGLTKSLWLALLRVDWARVGRDATCFWLCVALTACATSERIERSAPIEDRANTEQKTPSIAQPAAAPPQTHHAAPPVEQLARLHAPEVVTKPRLPAATQLLAAARQASASGDYQKAMAALERGLKLAPRDHELWQQLAYTHYQSGDLDQAFALAQRALSLTALNSPRRADSWRLISAIERARGDEQSARTALEKAQAE